MKEKRTKVEREMEEGWREGGKRKKGEGRKEEEEEEVSEIFFIHLFLLLCGC